MYRVTIGFVLEGKVHTADFDFQQKPEEEWRDYSVILSTKDRKIYVSTGTLCFLDIDHINNDQ